MAEDIVGRIRSAEAQAEDIREQGAARARDIVRQAQEAAAARLDAGLRAARAQADELEKQAVQAGAARAQADMAQDAQAQQAFSARVRVRIPAVAADIVERIVGA